MGTLDRPVVLNANPYVGRPAGKSREVGRCYGENLAAVTAVWLRDKVQVETRTHKSTESAARDLLGGTTRGAAVNLTIEVRSRASFFGFGFSKAIRIFNEAKIVDLAGGQL